MQTKHFNLSKASFESVQIFNTMLRIFHPCTFYPFDEEQPVYKPHKMLKSLDPTRLYKFIVNFDLFKSDYLPDSSRQKSVFPRADDEILKYL